MELAFQVSGRHILLPGAHLIRIAPDRVDLTVVDDETVRMRPLPAWIRIGAEPGVDRRHGRLIVRILEIREEGPELSHQEHPFVYDGPAGHGYDIRIITALLKHSPGDVQPAVKIQPFLYILRLLYKCLDNAGHTGSCLLSEDVREDRHLTPAQEFHSFFLHNDLEHFAGLVLFQLILGQEELGHAVFPFAADPDAFFFTDL